MYHRAGPSICSVFAGRPPCVPQSGPFSMFCVCWKTSLCTTEPGPSICSVFAGRPPCVPQSQALLYVLGLLEDLPVYHRARPFYMFCVCWKTSLCTIERALLYVLGLLEDLPVYHRAGPSLCSGFAGRPPCVPQSGPFSMFCVCWKTSLCTIERALLYVLCLLEDLPVYHRAGPSLCSVFAGRPPCVPQSGPFYMFCVCWKTSLCTTERALLYVLGLLEDPPVYHRARPFYMFCVCWKTSLCTTEPGPSICFVFAGRPPCVPHS